MKISLMKTDDLLNGPIAEKLQKMGLSGKNLNGCQINIYESGEYILHAGDSLEALYVIISGTAKVCVDARNGKNLIFCNYVSEGILGDVGFMLNVYVSTTTVVAATGFSCLTIPLSSNEKMLRKNSRFLNWVGKELAGKLLQRGNAHVASALFSSEERLCAYILQLEQNGIFREYLTETAESIGISYRHVFRIINKLCDEGILEKKKEGFLILDKEWLQGKACYKI